MKKLIHSNEYPGLMLRLTVGLVFLSEGIQKFLLIDFAMTMLLVFLLIYGGGHRYTDFIRYAKRKD
jgi:predicted ABC-type exoprotein transport system permease subunit